MPKQVDAELRVKLMNSLNKAGIESSNGNQAQADKALREAWELLPPPQHEWDFGQLVIQQTISFYLKAGRPHEARSWLEPLALSFGTADDGTVAMITGIVHFETASSDLAYERFDFLFKNYGKRPFQGKDKKYLDFYLSEKSKR